MYLTRVISPKEEIARINLNTAKYMEMLRISRVFTGNTGSSCKWNLTKVMARVKLERDKRQHKGKHNSSRSSNNNN
jgi:hypothetical protein